MWLIHKKEKCILPREYFSFGNKWKLLDAKSDLYGRWSNMSQPKCCSRSWVAPVKWERVLLWIWMIPWDNISCHLLCMVQQSFGSTSHFGGFLILSLMFKVHHNSTHVCIFLRFGSHWTQVTGSWINKYDGGNCGTYYSQMFVTFWNNLLISNTEKKKKINTRVKFRVD